MVHVSVQLFSNEMYAIRMSSERQLLTRMVISLYNMLSLNLIQSNMTCEYLFPQPPFFHTGGHVWHYRLSVRYVYIIQYVYQVYIMFYRQIINKLSLSNLSSIITLLLVGITEFGWCLTYLFSSHD